MKTKIYIPLLALAVAFVSCDNDLEAPTVSSLDAQSVFTQYDLAQNAILGIYTSFGETDSHRSRFIPYYGFNTDIEWFNGMDPNEPTDGDKVDIAKYYTLTTNKELNKNDDTYAKAYEGIERANIAIEGLREFADLDDPDMAQFLGEALTLRAVYYLDLIKGWGDVPMRFEPNSSETMYMPREDHDLIFQQLLDDLKEAGELCYWPNENSATSTVERVSAAFAKALRARIALYAGGYSLRQDKTIRLSNILDRTEMYKIAKEECIDVIENGSNALGEFYDTFHDQSTDVITAGRESIWEIPFSDIRGRVLYTYGVRHKSANQYQTQAKGGINGPTPFLYYDYDVEDVRRDVTCVPYCYGETLDANGNAQQELESGHRWSFGKLRYEWLAGAPSYRIVTNSNDDGINWMYMRLADVYLMAAEAINELEGPSAAAEYLRPILERALPADKVTTYMSQYTASKEAFFEGIVEQRKLEFAGEMLRKADLIRWNMLKEKLDEATDKTVALALRQGDYSDLPDNVYYANTSDGETLDEEGEYIMIYGLNHGDTDEVGKEKVSNEGYVQKGWLKSLLDDDGLPAGYENNYYFNNGPVVDPDKQQYWPIMQEFTESSNNMLNNDWLDK